jgi:AraC-like DNA-binding protein
VPLAHKRALVDALLAAHGPLALLRIGEAIADAPDEPALLALALATGPADLLARWQRLERFVHSRHRLLLRADGPQRLQLRHVSLASASPPSAAEHLLVLGLLVALARLIGTPGLQAAAGTPVQWRWRDGVWQGPAAGDVHGATCDALADWHWSWQPQTPARAGPPDPDWADAASRLLAADPGRSWTLALLASALGSSPRTLQRQLAGQGRCFSQLLMAARLAHSARLLATTAQPTAAIGYHCGFADQAHFTRAFKQHSAMTPAQYRSDFRLPAAGPAPGPAAGWH